MKIQILADADAAAAALRLTRTASTISIAVAWATKSAVSQAVINSGKVSSAVIGTHMYITDPDVLRSFGKIAGARVIAPDAPRLFHPKVYLFSNGDRSAAIVGSHNMTRNAFESNVEASVLLEGDSSDSLFRELRAFIRQSWRKAEAIDEDDFLYGYEIQYRARKKAKKELRTFHRIRRPNALDTEMPLMGMEWADYLRRVKSDGRLDLVPRLELLERARVAFASHSNFASMSEFERKAIAATYGPVEQQLDDITWRWFGNMSGQGNFASLIKTEPTAISAALDHIPLSGTVSQEQFDCYVSAFTEAFEGKAHMGRYPTATRLLAIKRPDQFVAVNSQNVDGLCAAAGCAPTTLNLENFWDRIMVPIRLSPWWLANKPTTPIGARVWECRAAMLDAIYHRA